MAKTKGIRARRSRAAAVLALLGAVGSGRARRYEIAEESMRPTLDHGDWIVAIRRPRNIRPGDVVVLEHPDRPGFEMIKRVHTVAADGITVLGDDPQAGSVDSTRFGPVPPGSIVARALLRYRPLPPAVIR